MKLQKKRPVLKQEWNLGPKDFARYPVWRCVHGVDQDESWYDLPSCDEATFRPWEGALPANFTEARLLLVAATLTLKNGQIYPGACYAKREAGRPPSQTLGLARQLKARISGSQPRLFLKGKTISFWRGTLPADLESRGHFYDAVGDHPSKIFPIVFRTNEGIIPVPQTGVIKGFYPLSSEGGRGLGKQTIAKEWLDHENVEFSSSSRAMLASSKELERIKELQWNGNPEQALLECDQLIEKYPHDGKCWSARSVVNSILDRVQAALTDSICAVRCTPDEPRYYLHVCLIMCRLGDYASGVSYSDAGLALESSSRESMLTEGNRYDLLFLGARGLFALGRFEEAKDRLKQIDYPGFEIANRGDKLLTRRGLTKACNEAIEGLRSNQAKEKQKPIKNRSDTSL